MILDFDGNGVSLTNAEGGVVLDIEGNGKPSRVAWTQKGSDDAFLVYDINKNGTVEPGELVGSRLAVAAGSVPKSGASLLGLYLQGISLDSQQRPVGALPDGAGLVDRNDAAYASMMVWTDINHDAVAQPAEVRTLSAAGVKGMHTGFQRTSTKDAAGNSFLFKGTFLLESQGAASQKPLLEVALVR